MGTAHRSVARRKPSARAADGERVCLATGESLPKDAMIRFVIAPDHAVVPDLARNLPGRGLWVKADRDAITLAARKNLFAKAAKTSVRPAADLADQVVALLRQRVLDLFGLARRAGLAVLGQPQVEAALKARKIALLILAADAGTALEKPNILTTTLFTRDELGAAFGYDQIVYAGLKPDGLVEKIRLMLTPLTAIASLSLLPEGSE